LPMRHKRQQTLRSTNNALPSPVIDAREPMGPLEAADCGRQFTKRRPASVSCSNACV
jgi:hypothetical protein